MDFVGVNAAGFVATGGVEALLGIPLISIIVLLCERLPGVLPGCFNADFNVTLLIGNSLEILNFLLPFKWRAPYKG